MKNMQNLSLTLSRIFFGKDLSWTIPDLDQHHEKIELNSPISIEDGKLYLSLTREARKIGTAVFSNDDLEDFNILHKDLLEFREFLASLFFAEIYQSGRYVTMVKIAEWLHELKSEYGQVVDWAGIYFKESHFHSSKKSTDLILGPYLGKSTSHVRIPLHKGFCGLALSEERVVNVEDVTSDSRHIACSLSTKSELVIPLKDKKGEFFAELDLDSNTLRAFTADLESKLTAFAATFPLFPENAK